MGNGGYPSKFTLDPKQRYTFKPPNISLMKPKLGNHIHNKMSSYPKRPLKNPSTKKQRSKMLCRNPPSGGFCVFVLRFSSEWSTSLELKPH